MKYLLFFITSFTLIHPLSAQWEHYSITEQSYQCSTTPKWVDVDNDGLVDILCYDENRQSLFWLSNQDGSFESASAIDSDIILESNTFMELDYDNDGDMDLLAQLETSNKIIRWNEYTNDGAGNFTVRQVQFESETHLGKVIAYQDLDGDGDRDLVLERWEAIDIYTNTDGNFTLMVSQTIPGHSPVYCIDWNMDGTYEIATTDRNQGIHIYNLDDRALVSAVDAFGAWTDDHILRLRRFIDYDNDGDLDVLSVVQELELGVNGDVGTADYGRTNCVAYENTSSGVVSHSVYVSDSNSDGAPYHIIGDVEGDGNIEWIIFDDTYQLYGLNAQNQYALGTSSNLSLPYGHSRISDVISLSSTGGGTIMSYVNQSNGIGIIPSNNASADLLNPSSWDPCINCQYAIDMGKRFYAADIDSDGDQDILTASLENQFQITWFENEEDCDFTMHAVTHSSDPSIIRTLDAVPGDFDKDGDVDLAIKEDDLNSTIKVIFNLDGKGSFGNEISIDNREWINSIYVRDLDQDGIDEIIVRQGRHSTISSYPEYNNVYIYRNVQDSDQLRVETVPTHSDEGELYFGDLDSDGDLDIVVNNSTPWQPYVEIFRNDGGQFSPEGNNLLPYAAIGTMDLFDVDGDGASDLITQQRSGDYNLFVYPNLDGVFDYDDARSYYSHEHQFELSGIKLDDDQNGFLVSQSRNQYPNYIRLVDLDGIITTLSMDDHQTAVALKVTDDDYHDILLGTNYLSYFTRNKFTSHTSNQELNSITTFPNPVAHTLHFSDQTPQTVHVYSSDGVLVLKQSITHTAVMDVSSLTPGIYVIQAQLKNETMHYGKFVKI